MGVESLYFTSFEQVLKTNTAEMQDPYSKFCSDGISSFRVRRSCQGSWSRGCSKHQSQGESGPSKLSSGSQRQQLEYQPNLNLEGEAG